MNKKQQATSRRVCCRDCMHLMDDEDDMAVSLQSSSMACFRLVRWWTIALLSGISISWTMQHTIQHTNTSIHTWSKRLLTVLLLVILLVFVSLLGWRTPKFQPDCYLMTPTDTFIIVCHYYYLFVYTLCPKKASPTFSTVTWKPNIKFWLFLVWLTHLIGTADTTCHRMTIQFPTSLNVCFCTTKRKQIKQNMCSNKQKTWKNIRDIIDHNLNKD